MLVIAKLQSRVVDKRLSCQAKSRLLFFMASCLHSDQTALLTQLVQAHDLLSVSSHVQAAGALVGSTKIIHSEALIDTRPLPEKPFE
jgi:hypothetical protein